MKKLITLLIIALLGVNCFAQDQHLIDSLSTLLKTAKEDTIKANILYSLSTTYIGINPDRATELANQCLTLSEHIDFKRGIGNAYSVIGCTHDVKGNYLPALEFNKKSLKVREEIRDKKGIAGSINNIGLIYYSLGNYPEALKNYFSALKMNEELGNKKWQAINLSNIGNIYIKQGNYPEALKNHFAAIKIYVEIGNKLDLADSYNNVGLTYGKQSNYAEALKNLFASLKINEEIGEKEGIALSYKNFGNIYEDQSNYPEALKNYFASLKMAKEIGAEQSISLAYLNIGNVYTKLKKYNAASEYLDKGILLSKEIGALEGIKDGYLRLATLDSSKSNFKQAYEHHKQFIIYRDSLVNNEYTKKTVALQMNYDFDKKQDSLIALQAKKDLIYYNEKNKQRLLRNGFIGGFAVMALFAGIFFRQRNKIKKGKQKSDELLLNILPYEVAEELKDTGTSKAKNFDEATVMFTDFKDFTKISEEMSPEELVKEIDTCFSAFDSIIQKYGVEKIKTIGDAYMCAGGLPVANHSHAEDVVKAALEIRDFMTNHNKEKVAKGEVPFEIRIGINSGPVVAGIIGVRKFAYDIWGDTVNLANRMESHGGAGKVNISRNTYELIEQKFICTHRGKIMTKGKGEVDMYFVEQQI